MTIYPAGLRARPTSKFLSRVLTLLRNSAFLYPGARRFKVNKLNKSSSAAFVALFPFLLSSGFLKEKNPVFTESNASSSTCFLSVTLSLVGWIASLTVKARVYQRQSLLCVKPLS